MYKTIMVPTDCSGFDREAIRVALRLAERTAARVHLVRVISVGTFFGAGASDGATMTVEAVRQQRDNALSELYALAAECRANTTAEVVVALEQGPVTDVLAGYACRHDVNLIVISTHGRSGISRLSLGSVTDSLIRHTAIPVLVVKPAASYLNPQVAKPFARIVVPLDGSTLAEQILSKVAEIAELEGSELTLLYVLKPHDEAAEDSEDSTVPWWDRDVNAAQSYLYRKAAKLRRAGFSVTTDIIVGNDVAEEISGFASRTSADLIAIATHGRGGLSRMIRGSVADAVTRSAFCSTLVFHPDRQVEVERVSEKQVANRFVPAFAS